MPTLPRRPDPRWRRLLEKRAPVVVPDSPSLVVRVRSAGVNDGTFVFGYGCAARAGNPVAQDAATLLPFVMDLRPRLAITVFFLRCARPRALPGAPMLTCLEPRRRPVRGLQAYSRTRWYGQAATIAAVQENKPALRHTLFTNTVADNTFDVPTTVNEALEALSRAPIGQSTPILKALTAVVALLEADAAPLSSYAGVLACVRLSWDTIFLEISL